MCIWTSAQFRRCAERCDISKTEERMEYLILIWSSDIKLRHDETLTTTTSTPPSLAQNTYRLQANWSCFHIYIWMSYLWKQICPFTLLKMYVNVLKRQLLSKNARPPPITYKHTTNIIQIHISKSIDSPFKSFFFLSRNVISISIILLNNNDHFIYWFLHKIIGFDILSYIGKWKELRVILLFNVR